MAGGTLLPGRVDNHILSRYLPDFDALFACFLQFRREWSDIVAYIQRISPGEYGQTPPLSICGGYTVKGDHGTRNTANEAALAGHGPDRFHPGPAHRPRGAGVLLLPGPARPRLAAGCGQRPGAVCL